MTKKELKTAPLNLLIMDLAETNAMYTIQLNITGHYKRSYQHLVDVCNELLRREVLTEQNVQNMLS